VRLIINLEEMKTAYEAAKLDYNTVSSKTAKLGIYKELRQLSRQIDDEERRQNSSLKSIEIDGVLYLLPYYFNRSDNIEVHNGCLYKFEKPRYDNDGSYYFYNYVWIPQAENKYACLLVKILGGDIYGERYYLTVDYYKHPSDYHSYLTKKINCQNRIYKEYYTYVIERLGYKYKKDKWDANKLEKVNLKEDI